MKQAVGRENLQPVSSLDSDQSHVKVLVPFFCVSLCALRASVVSFEFTTETQRAQRKA